MSVDARTKGRRLDGYTPHTIDELHLLVDPDLHRLPVEVTVTTGGLLGRSLGIEVDGLDGAPCPIQLI